MELIKDFVSKSKSLLIAPAGFGKTHFIADCLKYIQTENKGRYLILTHTHAGISSIKEKLKKLNVSSRNYHIETISSYAQKYSLAYSSKEIPSIDKSTEYYDFIIKEANEIIKNSIIKEIIRNSYKGLFVDEYQDCNADHHNLILSISENISTHILGDPLQGIFNFKGQSLVDMTDKEQMGEFLDNKYELSIPWRWNQDGNNKTLGEGLLDIRKKLENQENFDLSEFSKHITIVPMSKNDEHLNFREKPIRTVWRLMKEKSLLVIHPNSMNKIPRENFIKTFGESFSMIEAIDDKNFYKFAKDFDLSTTAEINKSIQVFLYACFTKKSVSKWLYEDKNIKKLTENEKEIIRPINEKLNNLSKKVSHIEILSVLKEIKNLPGLKCYRKDLFESVCQALENSKLKNISSYEAMIEKRNKIRRSGRKIFGKCVGTTLLTKGLEFEKVVILNINDFEDPKNLYVALTRASKELIVFAKDTNINVFN